MIHNYLKITLRNILKHKGYSFVNIAGLAAGMASCLLILLFIQSELGYDRFHAKAERIFRVVLSTSDDGIPTNANGSYGLGPALKKDFPSVLEYACIRRVGQGQKVFVGRDEKKFFEDRFFFATPSLLTVFDFPLLRGNPATALAQPGTIVLTEDAAKKYF